MPPRSYGLSGHARNQPPSRCHSAEGPGKYMPADRSGSRLRLITSYALRACLSTPTKVAVLRVDSGSQRCYSRCRRREPAWQQEANRVKLRERIQKARREAVIRLYAEGANGDRITAMAIKNDPDGGLLIHRSIEQAAR